jgi:hypothetical protein
MRQRATIWAEATDVALPVSGFFELWMNGLDAVLDAGNACKEPMSERAQQLVAAAVVVLHCRPNSRRLRMEINASFRAASLELPRDINGAYSRMAAKLPPGAEDRYLRIAESVVARHLRPARRAA